MHFRVHFITGFNKRVRMVRVRSDAVRVRYAWALGRNPAFFNAERSIPPGFLAGESELLIYQTGLVQQSSSRLTAELL